MCCCHVAFEDRVAAGGRARGRLGTGTAGGGRVRPHVAAAAGASENCLGSKNNKGLRVVATEVSLHKSVTFLRSDMPPGPLPRSARSGKFESQ